MLNLLNNHNSSATILASNLNMEQSKYKSIWFILHALGFKIDIVSREEAAHQILERPIRIIYSPTIIEINEPSSTYK